MTITSGRFVSHYVDSVLQVLAPSARIEGLLKGRSEMPAAMLTFMFYSRLDRWAKVLSHREVANRQDGNLRWWEGQSHERDETKRKADGSEVTFDAA